MEMLKNKPGDRIKVDDVGEDVLQRFMNGHIYNSDGLIQDEGLKQNNLQSPAPPKSPRISQSASVHQLPFATICSPPTTRTGVTKLAGGNITMLDTRKSIEERSLKNRFKLSCQEINKPHKRSSTDDPYAFMDSDVEPSKAKKLSPENVSLSLKPAIVAPLTSPIKSAVQVPESTANSPSSTSNTNSVMTKPSSSIAKLYPQLAQKLEKPKPKVEAADKGKGKTDQKPTRTSKSSKTMNRLQSKIAQNKIKDKLKKTQTPSNKPLSSSLVEETQTVPSPIKKTVKTSVEATPPSSLPGTTASYLKDKCLKNTLGTNKAVSVSSSVVHHFASTQAQSPSLSASERLSWLGQSHMPQMSPKALAGLLSASQSAPQFTSPSGIPDTSTPIAHPPALPKVVNSYSNLPPHLLSSIQPHLKSSLLGPVPQLPAGLSPQWPMTPLIIPGDRSIKPELSDPVPAPSLAHPPTWPTALHAAQRSPKKSPEQLCVKQPSPVVEKEKCLKGSVVPVPVMTTVSDIIKHERCLLRPHRRKNVQSLDEVKRRVKRHSALTVYTRHKQRKEHNSTFLPYGIDSSDDDASDNEEIFPWQCGVMSTFSESDDEAHEDDDLDQQIASTIRLTKLDLLRGKLRRHVTEKIKALKGNRELHVRNNSTLSDLVRAAYLDPHAASTALLCVNELGSKNKTSSKDWSDDSVKQRRCLQQVDDDGKEACDKLALPYSNHCLSHIMYNVDQQLFDYCTAKFSNNTQCCVPVFDIRHELPLCPEHAAKADNYQKNLDSKPKKPRKRTKPSALTRPPKKGKKKKNQKKFRALKLPSPVQTDLDETENVEVDIMSDEKDTEDESQSLTPCSSQDPNSQPTIQDSQSSILSRASILGESSPIDQDTSSRDEIMSMEEEAVSVQTTVQPDLNISKDLDSSLEDPLYSSHLEKTLGLPSEFLEEHDIQQVLDRLPQDALDILTGGNGGFMSGNMGKEDEDAVLAQFVDDVTLSNVPGNKLPSHLINDNSNDHEDEVTKQIAYSILNQNLSPTGSIGDDINHDNLNALASSISANDLKQISQELTHSVLNSALDGVAGGSVLSDGCVTTSSSRHGVVGTPTLSFPPMPAMSQPTINLQPPVTAEAVHNLLGIAPGTSGAFTFSPHLQTLTLDQSNGSNFSQAKTSQNPMSFPPSQTLIPGSSTSLGTMLQLQQLLQSTAGLDQKPLLGPAAGTTGLPAGLGVDGLDNPSGLSVSAATSTPANLLTWGTALTPQTLTHSSGSLPASLPTLAPSPLAAQNLALGGMGLKLAYPVQALLPGATVVATAPDGSVNFTPQAFSGQTLLALAAPVTQTQSNTPNS